jgi:hypothetical protein
MRLINTITLEVGEFFDGHAPKYGILSHRWLDGEITLQEMQAGTAAKKPGYEKVANVCQLALQDGLGYAWVDTCCIDKTSSAELSEAINSMYRWYSEAEMCYAFLNDVTVDEVTFGAGEDAFANSLWFTRGWTLQELIAPGHVKFYNASWRQIGTRASLCVAIAAITQIDVAMLEADGELEKFSIAQRMSWASRRVTTRAEDMGYCLLGIFGVNMPMLYGEGGRAFIRLQEEIMKNSDDHSLFAWSSDAKVARGLLARSPADFANSADIYTTETRWNKVPYALSNLGLSIQLPSVPWAMDTYLAALDCKHNGQRLGIFLRMLPQENRYARVIVNGEDITVFTDGLAAKLLYREVFVQQRIWGSELAEERFYGFWMRTLPEPVQTVEDLSTVATRGEWDDEERIFEIPVGKSGTAGAIALHHDRGPITIKVGLDEEFNPHVQFGGRIQSPDRYQTGRNAFEDTMHPSWMDKTTPTRYDGGHQNFVHRGTRLGGLLHESHERWLAEDGARDWRIFVFNGLIPKTGRMGWVVDIERWGSEDRGNGLNAICDGCRSVRNPRPAIYMFNEHALTFVVHLPDLLQMHCLRRL